MQTAPDSSVRSASEAGDAPLSTPQSLARALTLRRAEYIGKRRLRVKIGSWNTAGCTGTDKDVGSWFFRDEGLAHEFAKLGVSTNDKPKTADEPVDLYVLGLQEVVDLNTTKEYVNRVYAESNSQIAKWRSAVEAAIPTGYEFVSAEQMVGLLTLVYASSDLARQVTNVSTQQIGTGLLGYFGNKGAVATRIVVGETTRLVFINSHLASGTGPSYLDRRCWDVAQIASKMQFDPVVNNGVAEDESDKFGDEDFAFWLGDLNFRLATLPGDDIRRILTLHTRGEYDVSSDKPPKPLDGEPVIVMKDSESDEETATASSLQSHSREQSFGSETSLPDPDDFPEDPSQDPASLQATLDSLLPHDQLRQAIARRKAFHDGWKEGPITFLPTYKYDVGSVALFDTSEKQRAPSWCDRILYRTRDYKEAFEKQVVDEEAAKKKDEEMKSRGMEADEDVLFGYDPEEDGEEQESEPQPSTNTAYEYDEYDDEGEHEVTVPDRVELELYTSYQRITSSDHKPLTSVFTLTCDCVVPEAKAKVHAEVARQLDRAENEGRPVITLVLEGNAQEGNVVDIGHLSFLAKKSSSITIANTGSVPAGFSFMDRPAMDDSDASMHDWLKTSFVKPDGGEVGPTVLLEPGETITAVLDGQVSSIPFLRALNDGRASLEEVLVLRVDNGRDHFITVRGQWLPSCFGRSMDELIRVPEGGIRQFLESKQIRGAIPYDSEVHCSAPRELFKLTEAIQTLAERCAADASMLDDMALPGDAGWPFDGASGLGVDEKEAVQSCVVAALDTDAPIADVLPVELASPDRLEVLSSVLLLFLSSLTDGLIPAQLCARLSTTIPSLANLPPSAQPDAKMKILDVLSSAAPNHNIAFVFLTSTLARVAKELTPATAESRAEGLQRRLSFRKASSETETARKKQRAREKRYAELLAPLTFRTGSGEGKAGKEERERARAMLELFLGLEMQD